MQKKAKDRENYIPKKYLWAKDRLEALKSIMGYKNMRTPIIYLESVLKLKQGKR